MLYKLTSSTSLYENTIFCVAASPSLPITEDTLSSTTEDSSGRNSQLLNLNKNLLMFGLIVFADSLPSGKICTVGNNSFSFNSANKKLSNPTETNKILYVAQLLYDFCPANSSSLYTADSHSQYSVGVGKKESS